MGLPPIKVSLGKRLTSLNTLSLNKGAERRLKAGHLWVFSNEVDVAKTPLKSLQPGQAVSIKSSRGDFLGNGYANPHSLICARVCSQSEQQSFGLELIEQRLQTALQLREQLFDTPWYRLVHGEGDLLPGLVVDRYDDLLAVQITTAGIEQYCDQIVSLLCELTGATSVFLKNETGVRALEHLELFQRCVVGSLADLVTVVENGLKFEISVSEGQKTGWFYDHRYNRALLGQYCAGRRVLDVFSYAGGWALNAAAAGAGSVVAIDSSKRATAQLSVNAQLNSVADKVEVVTADAVETLKSLNTKGEKFDVVVLDPPAFIKRKKDYKPGLQHYALLNRLAMRLLQPGGYIATASCSQAMSMADLTMVAGQGARRAGHSMQVLHELSQAPDHPWLAGMPESHYLKGLIGRIV